MIIIMKKNSSKENLFEIENDIKDAGFSSSINYDNNHITIFINSTNGYIDEAFIKNKKHIFQIIHTTDKIKLVYRKNNQADTIVDLGNDISIGGNDFQIISGPCSIENLSQIDETASFLSSIGIKILRGGAFKPRTSPYSFQGLEEKGVKLLTDMGNKYKMKTISEAIDKYSLDIISESVDMIQIGARNMQNYALLKECGKLNKPIFLKRGYNASIEELLISAEYILAGGNPNVILCERGVKGNYGISSGFSLDLLGISDLKALTHLPIMVDPSHAAKKRERVIQLAKAATAFGNDGLMIEIHPTPHKALSDGPQSLNFKQMESLVKDIDYITKITDKKLKLYTK